MKENRTKHMYFSLDSDILRSLTYLSILLNYNPNATSEDVNDDQNLASFFESCKILLNLVKEDKVRLEVSETIYQENKHSSSVLKFIKEYVYASDDKGLGYLKKAEKVAELVEKYCSPYVSYGTTKPAPYRKTYVSAVKKFLAPNDVCAIAEATVGMTTFLTFNAKHTTLDKRIKGDVNSKSNAVIAINLSQGYYEENPDGTKSVPKPLAFPRFAPLLKNFVELKNIMAYDDTKIKFSECSI